jgi:Fe-S cluster assembly iron-binding protein IscA
MLQITAAAEQAIRLIREDSELPESTALRIAPIPGPDGGVAIGFAFTDGPDDGDLTISDKEDFRVYLAPDLTRAFDGAALDATASEEGVELELRTQAELHENGSRLEEGSKN